MAIRMRNWINPLIYGPESKSAIWNAMDCGFGLLFFYEFLFIYYINYIPIF